MSSTLPSALKNWPSYATGVIVGTSLLFGFIGVTQAYSYWWDELYVASTASLGMRDLFNILILHDVHPPLYNISINLWESMFGDSEPALRSLSFICTAVAVLIMWRGTRGLLPTAASLAVLIVFSTNHLVAFYAQEARSYAMMLCLSAALTVSYANDYHKANGWKFAAFTLSALTLSLTHYFGLIYAGVIILAALYPVRARLVRLVSLMGCGAICLVWPATHLMLGTVISKTGDNFWIKSEGWQTTLYEISSAITPQLAGSSSPYVVAVIFIAFVAIMYWLATKKPVTDDTPCKTGIAKLFFPFVGFIVLMILIDYHSPMSTKRNYIVLLPLFSLIAGMAVQGLLVLRFRYALHVALIIGLSNLSLALKEAERKMFPLQNLVGAAEFVEGNLSEHDKVYYLRHSNIRPDMEQLIIEYYFRNGPVKDILPISWQQLERISAPFFLLVQHQPQNIELVAAQLDQNGISYTKFMAQDKWKGAAVFYSH